MARVYITKILHFNAAHRLHSEQRTDKENSTIYGSCNNANFHGHNYELHVTVYGEPDPITGMVMDLKELKDIVTKEIIDRVDHKNFNMDVDFMQGIVPTAENIVIAFWQILFTKLSGKLYKLELWETPRNMASYKGE